MERDNVVGMGINGFGMGSDLQESVPELFFPALRQQGLLLFCGDCIVLKLVF